MQTDIYNKIYLNLKILYIVRDLESKMKNSQLRGSNVSLRSVIKNYIYSFCINKKQNPTYGMKTLVLDDDTMTIISMVCGKSQLISQQVIYFEKIDHLCLKEKVDMQLKAVCFLRPTITNLEKLQTILSKKLYTEYYLFWNNIIPEGYLEKIAQADKYDAIKTVDELYADYYPVCDNLFSIQSTSYTGPNESAATEALISLCLSCKIKPTIRYQSGSHECQKLATDLHNKILEESAMFTSLGSQDPSTVLLIVDRKSDCITSLLQPWTYQAMIHEFLGINNGRVNLPCEQNTITAEDVLNSEDDVFFKNNMFSSYGTVLKNISELVTELQKKTNTCKKLETIQETDHVKYLECMQESIDLLPEYKQLVNMTTRHFSIINYIKSCIDTRNLYECSLFEQEICTSSNIDTINLKMITYLQPTTGETSHIESKLRLLCVYALKHSSNPKNQTRQFIQIIQNSVSPSGGHAAPDLDQTVSDLLNYSNQHEEVQDPSVKKFLHKIVESTSSLKLSKDPLNLHTPKIIKTLKELLKGKLDANNYPYIDSTCTGRDHDSRSCIIFFVGGTTYQELSAIQELLQQKEYTDRDALECSNYNILLGGTSIHNSISFLQSARSLGTSSVSQIHGCVDHKCNIVLDIEPETDIIYSSDQDQWLI